MSLDDDDGNERFVDDEEEDEEEEEEGMVGVARAIPNRVVEIKRECMQKRKKRKRNSSDEVKNQRGKNRNHFEGTNAILMANFNAFFENKQKM